MPLSKSYRTLNSRARRKSIAFLLLMGCASSKSSPSQTADAGDINDMDAMAMDGGGMMVSCANDARIAHYSNGLLKTGQSQKAAIKFTSAEPAPPARGDNRWDIQVLDNAGNPMEASITLALDMPDHGHASPTTPVITPGSSRGSFLISSINLFMPGVWRAELSVYQASDAGARGPLVDVITLMFCIEG